VINVNVSDAVAYCQWVSKETGTTVRLPEENEWEYAARGGKKSKRYEYSGSNTVGDVAWYGDNSGRKTHEVATKRPNELGLYDMSGNVWEWCGTHGVLRGGSWGDDALLCRVSGRGGSNPDYRSLNYGFRLLQKK
jgi:formylglycine-generating enzyme required for sulfatase activity